MSSLSRNRLSVECLEVREQPANFVMGMIFITPDVDSSLVAESRTQTTAEDVGAVAIGASTDIRMKGSTIGGNAEVGETETLTSGEGHIELSGWGSSAYQYAFAGTYY